MSYDKYNGKIYGVKEMNIKLVAMTNNVKHILHEKKILSELHHPFIINLLDHYKDDLNLYYVLEFCHGCDLFSVLVRIYGGKEDASKFSITQKVIEHGKAQYVLKIEIVKVYYFIFIIIEIVICSHFINCFKLYSFNGNYSQRYKTREYLCNSKRLYQIR